MDALEWLYDALWRLVDRLGRWVTAYKPELFCAVPLALIVGGGVYGTADTMQRDGLAVLIVLEVMVVIIANPFHCWDRLLPPRSRTLMAAGILIALLPVAYFGMMPEITALLWTLAVGLWVIALWRRRLWLGLYRVRQSPDVDTVLAHLSHDGDWEAGRAWETYGCRETRALLHQAIEAECNEAQMHRTYMPVYLLGYLHGKAAEVRRGEKAQGQQANAAALERTVQEQQAQLTALKGELAAAQRERDTAKKQASDYWARAHVLEMRLEALQLDPAARDDAILAYVEAGHTYTEAGIKYGLTKPGAVSAAKRAREKREDKGNA
ncbi:MAG: hypothetical protein LIO70_07965 [Clostridiales bacterium]|nr:hypothetical protein [Clostridiales bacterium]